jgi:hypothetical protein
VSTTLWFCNRCEWSGQEKDLLTAPSPFDASDIMSACPDCKDYESIVNRCDEPGCRREAGCGFQVDGGYRRTCYEHSVFARAQEGPKS